MFGINHTRVRKEIYQNTPSAHPVQGETSIEQLFSLATPSQRENSEPTCCKPGKVEQVTRVDSQNMGVYTVYRLGNGSDCPCTETPKERQAILVITIQNFEVNSAVEYLQYCCQYFPSCGK